MLSNEFQAQVVPPCSSAKSGGSQVVNLALFLFNLLFEEENNQQDGDQSKGSIDIEHPAPIGMVHDQASNDGTQQTRNAPHPTEEPLHSGSFLQCENITHQPLFTPSERRLLKPSRF
jgi:hypothetical protein